jgi:hypothetical protein
MVYAGVATSEECKLTRHKLQRQAGEKASI